MDGLPSPVWETVHVSYGADMKTKGNHRLFLLAGVTVFSMAAAALGASLVLSQPFGEGPASGLTEMRVDLYQGNGTGGASLVRLSEYGGQALAVNFWAVECPPCRAEMPALEKIHQRYKDEGLVVLGVDVGSWYGNYREDGQAKEFLEEVAVTYPVGRPQGPNLAADYGLTAIPTTFFVRPDGTIYGKWVGIVDERSLADVVEVMLR